MKNVLIAGALLVPLVCAAQKIRCPERYPAKDVIVNDVPKGWQGVGNVLSDNVVSGAGAIIGPAQGRGELRGHDRKTRDGYEIRFAGLNDNREPLEKWIYCAYGAGGEVQLLHRVVEGASECVVKYRRKKVPDSPEITITCK